MKTYPLTVIQKFTALALVAALLCFSTGCASIVTGMNRKVTFKSDPEGAKVTIASAKGVVVAEGITPFTVKLRKGKPYFANQKYTVTFSKEGYFDTQQQVKSTLNGWYLGNIVFGGLVGLLIVDPLTGAMYTLPKEVSANLNMKSANASDETELRIVQLQDLTPELQSQLVRIN